MGMRHYRRPGIVGGILVTATVVAALPAIASVATPTVHELPTPAGYQSSEATAVNNLGTVVGYAANGFIDTVAVKWSRNGTVTVLGALPGDRYSDARGINDLGEIVGSSSNDDGVQHAVEWNAAGTITDLGVEPGYRLSISEGNAINDFGEVAGADQITPREVDATRWVHGTLDDFGLAQEDQIGNSYANAVNDLGQIAGIDFLIHGLASQEAVRWNPDGTVLQLPYLVAARGAETGANGINNLGVVAGTSPTATPGQPHAVRWDAQGHVTDLGTAPGGVTSYGNGINDLGVIVGSADDAAANTHAVTWSATGTLRELPALPGGSAGEALAVSDTGFIVGDADDAAGNDVAVLWH